MNATDDKDVTNANWHNPKWYGPLLESLKALQHNKARMRVVEKKHKIGTILLGASKELKMKGLTNREGWSEEMGAFMRQVAKDIGTSVPDLLDCLKFAETYPDLKAFLDSPMVKKWRESRPIIYAEKKIQFYMSQAIFSKLEAEKTELGQTWEQYLFSDKLKDFTGVRVVIR